MINPTQLLAWLASLAFVVAMTRSLPAEECALYIASPADPPVIYRSMLDLESGRFGELEVAAGDVHSGFLALHPTLPILYAATTEGNGENNGAVRAYAISPDDASLRLINQASTADSGNTHIAVAPDGSAVVQCHYGGRGTTALPLADDGSLIDRVSHIAHEGSSVHPQRQTQPHPHGVAIHPSSRYVCVADLGSDRVEVFTLSRSAELARHSYWKAADGAGPRHVAFDAGGKKLYCINELDSTIAVLDFDAQTGQLTERQTVSTLADDFEGQNSTAEIAIHPSGQFLYGSNRGHDSTAVFAVDPNDGTLRFVEREPTRGEHPRYVGVEPSGKIYVAANLFTGNLVSFHIDEQTGELKPTGHQVEVPRPMSIAFVP